VKLIPFTFHPEGDWIELVGISDLHYGAKTFLPKKAQAHRQYILDHPDRKVVDMGDREENALPDSPGRSHFDQTCSPSEQREWVREYYRPMKDRVIAVVASNHPGRSERKVDWSSDETFMAFLDLPKQNYVRWERVLSVTVGDSRCGQNYTILVRHYVSNSANPGTIFRSMFNKARACQGCDVYWFAHCHQYLYEPLPTSVPDSRHRKMREIEQHFLMADSFMAFEGSYAEESNWTPPTPGQVSLVLHKSEHKIEVKRLLY
jgi:hypothetical protein